MSDLQIKQNALYAAKKEKIIESIEAMEARDVSEWSESLFFSAFETPAEHIQKCAKEFREDITPF